MKKVTIVAKRVFPKVADYSLMYHNGTHRAIVSFTCPHCRKDIFHFSTVQFHSDLLELYEEAHLPKELAFCPRCGNKLKWGD